jgi:putative transposase
VLGAPRASRQQAYIERVIGAIRRECLDHLIIFDEASLLRRLKSFLVYYHGTRTHLSLAKDAPEHRAVQEPVLGEVVAIPQVGGFHHRYECRAACSVQRATKRFGTGAVLPDGKGVAVSLPLWVCPFS